MTAFLRQGHGEGFKCVSHGAMGLLAAAFTGYNVAAYVVRRESHLFANGVIYFSVMALECRKVYRHWCAR